MSLEDIRQKLAGIQNKGGSKKIWKPKTKHQVRILPYSDEDLGLKLLVHYSVDNGKKMYCPTSWDNACPFCEFGDHLLSYTNSDGTQKSKEQKNLDWKLYKDKVKAGEKYYVPVVVRKEDGSDVDGPFFWEMTPKVYAGIIERIVLDPDYNSMSVSAGKEGGYDIVRNVDYGLDLTVTLKEKGKDGNQTSYDLTEVEPRKMFTSLSKNQDVVKKILDSLPKESDITQVVTTAAAQKIFDKYSMASDSVPTGSEDDGVEHGENVKTGGSQVDAIMDKLLGMVDKK